ncbi:hypothetical protein J7T55_002589 [Diaporthe amygdali]|uniref:uncharacterized protein n=1 Tax=Phomopsis amygdali TaxID=1214568 RepID=UPI0022FDFECB|nr:uncharacterized protein J7T55_002589 [Diaporthe amygdali]KAJ0122078.1 hypothetical protein J7T55_002589 [Diaporthe amygdali]
MRLISNLIVLGLGLVGSALATNGVCCRPNCGICTLEECYRWNPCISPIFNTCCSDARLADKNTVVFENDQDYLAAVAAGHVNE